METKEYFLKINHEGKIINVTGITANSILIDFSGDIDFTKLVSELTYSIDSKKQLIPNKDNDTSQDDTLKLVLATIESIIGEYNNTVKTLVESYDNVDSVTEDDPLF